MVDVLLAIALAIVAFIGMYLGVHVTLHPVESTRTRNLYKFGFVVCGVVTIILVAWQATRNHESQSEAAQALQVIKDGISAVRRTSAAASDGAVQRYLPEDRIGAMVDALWLAKDYKVFLMRGGSFEAEGFAAQVRLTFIAGRWAVVGDGRAFPPRDPKDPILIQGMALDDPGVLAAKSAFAIAGFTTAFKQADGPPQSLMLYF